MQKSYLGLQIARPQNGSFAPVMGRNNSTGRAGRNLKTPIRRFFRLELLRSRTRGTEKKRARTYAHDTPCNQLPDSPEATPPPSSDTVTSPTTVSDIPSKDQTLDGPSPQHIPSAPCVTLQNSDSTMDTVVTSTLFELPLFCHDGLLTMSPTRIIEVAQEMNGRLPEALKVDLREPRNLDQIRREVEVLVGLVKAKGAQVPGAPLKRGGNRGRQVFSKVLDKDTFRRQELSTISPPTSPLAAISAIRRTSRAKEADVTVVVNSAKLGTLQEGDEDKDLNLMEIMEQSKGAEIDEDEDFFRVTKKRKTSGSPKDVQMATLQAVRRVQIPLAFRNTYEDVHASPSPRRPLMNHSQSSMLSDEVSASPAVVTNRDATGPTAVGRLFINTRARYCSPNKLPRVQRAALLGQGQGPLQTSTPRIAGRTYPNTFFESYVGERS